MDIIEPRLSRILLRICNGAFPEMRHYSTLIWYMCACKPTHSTELDSSPSKDCFDQDKKCLYFPLIILSNRKVCNTLFLLKDKIIIQSIMKIDSAVFLLLTMTVQGVHIRSNGIRSETIEQGRFYVHVESKVCFVF